LPAPFAHLETYSGHSLRFGTFHPADLATHAAELEQPAAGLTDRDSLSGAVVFMRACQKVGVKPVIGVNLAILHEANALPSERLIFYGRGPRGWAGLCRLVTAAHRGTGAGTGAAARTAGAQPGLTAAEAQRLTLDYQLTIGFGHESQVAKHLARHREDLAKKNLIHWREQIGTDQMTVILTASKQKTIAGKALALASFLSLSVIATNAVRYLKKEKAITADLLDAAKNFALLRYQNTKTEGAESYLKTSTQMSRAIQEICAYADSLGTLATNPSTPNQVMAQTLDFATKHSFTPADLGMNLIHKPTPKLDKILQSRCQLVLAKKPKPYQERLYEELAIIAELGYARYFLTVAEIVDMTKALKIRVAARGSAAGSLVVHALGISRLDPLEHGLLMQRFLSTLRRGLPDIDIDVESARRLEVYDAIFKKFGSDRCACVSMVDTYRVRHAIRDVGAAYGLPPGEVDFLAKAFPHISARRAREALASLPELRRSGLAKLVARGQLGDFFELVESLDRLPRHRAMHPCGVVLADAALLDHTPVQPSASGYQMSQFDKDDVEDLGFLKVDVLGVRMQSALAYAVSEIARTGGVAPDIDAVDLEDHKTFELIRSTKTLGCFQIESPGQRELIGKFSPETFEDLIIDISLFRPGPVQSDMITPFLAARHGLAEPDFFHPDLEPVLAPTFGVVVFHEQVISILSVMTGCSLARAEVIRRELGLPDKMAEIQEWFEGETKARGYAASVRSRVWQVLAAFASFGFCKAHAAAFAWPTFQSAWVKAHYPAAFYAGVLTHDPGMYPKRLILDDARNFGVTVLPLEINSSKANWQVEKGALRVALSEVKGISDDEVQSVVANAPYLDIEDFRQRAQVSMPILEGLVKLGAFDCLYRSSGPTRQIRRDLLLHVRETSSGHAATARRGAVRKRPAAAQLALSFTGGVALGGVAPTGLPAMTTGECVQTEIENLNLDLTCHLIDFYRELLSDLRVTPSKKLLDCRTGQTVLVAGVKVSLQTPPMRSGKRVIFITLDDSTGPVDVTFFEDVQVDYASTVFSSWLLLAKGVVRRTGARGVSVRALGCWGLGEIREGWLAGGVAGANHLMTPRKIAA